MSQFKEFVYSALTSLGIGIIFLVLTWFIKMNEFSDPSGSMTCYLGHSQSYIPCKSEEETQYINCNEFDWCQRKMKAYENQNQVKLCMAGSIFVLTWFLFEMYCMDFLLVCLVAFCTEYALIIYYMVKPITLLAISIFLWNDIAEIFHIYNYNVISYALYPTMLLISSLEFFYAAIVFFWNQCCCCQQQ